MIRKKKRRMTKKKTRKLEVHNAVIISVIVGKTGPIDSITTDVAMGFSINDKSQFNLKYPSTMFVMIHMYHYVMNCKV